MERARAFYEAVFECQLSPLASPGMTMLGFPSDISRPGAAGSLVKMDGVASGGNSTIIYFASQNCALEAARALAAGGKVEREKMSIGQYGFITLLVDTEGNMIGVHSME
jgi:predicted enzyme related to lactoylglutathione lyase